MGPVDLPMSLASPTMEADEGRRVVNEMDFFSLEKSRTATEQDSYKAQNRSLEKEDLTMDTGLHLLSGSDLSMGDGFLVAAQETDERKSEMTAMKAKMGQMEEENQRLRNILAQMNQNYNYLHRQFISVMHKNKSMNGNTNLSNEELNKLEEGRDGIVPKQFLDGRSLKEGNFNGDYCALKSGFNGDQEEGKETVSMFSSSSSKSCEQAQEATMRKARVSVRVRSDAPMVQRCADDQTILITSYEGKHNHPLPPAAMSMASTTSAAASMLLSGTISSADSLMNPNILAQAVLPCPSGFATISASAPFPTVTLDLTQPPNPLLFQKPSSQLQFSIPALGRPTAIPQIFGQSLQCEEQQGLSIADTVSAATAALTANPNFTAALAAAITSIIGGGGGGGGGGAHQSGSQACVNDDTPK
ncbi:hypothetical protein M5K25_008558 [Dendrobium thyrsiflorum]|uniref:WRKY domain-containing protein n=1 Tax=Dendrobium thyrsiflorum TaxID=117978 RepID=A0ABD0V9S7_DENTH